MASKEYIRSLPGPPALMYFVRHHKLRVSFGMELRQYTFERDMRYIEPGSPEELLALFAPRKFACVAEETVVYSPGVVIEFLTRELQLGPIAAH